jgi:hypothetical protein
VGLCDNSFDFENNTVKVLGKRNKERIIPIEITAAGIEAEIVIPTLSPRYAFAAPKTTAKIKPTIIEVIVSSGTILSAGIKGLKFLFSLITLLLYSKTEKF